MIGCAHPRKKDKHINCSLYSRTAEDRNGKCSQQPDGKIREEIVQIKSFQENMPP